MKSYKEVRNIWISFWKSKGHEIIESKSLVPFNDPTLLWINSGMAPLKKYFDGREVPNNPRICSIQKCMRTNDIENVGFTARHHTFFEMLGNFSIGDYFRSEVLPWAYELLTSQKYFGFSINDLYITYHPSDLDTYNLWVKLGISPQHLIPLKQNFWMIGNGPSGPDTEMFFDRGEKYDKEHLGIKLLQDDIENDRYIEIWNIVFSQYNAVEGKPISEYKELPKKNIDTGAGFERLCCILQGVENNFETDLFVPLIEELKKLATVPYVSENKFAYHVISDHIRAATFALSDGAVFANEGRGYVLRRIIRRAIRFAKKIGIDKPVLYTLAKKVVEIYADFYPYLLTQITSVQEEIYTEEIKFMKTLESGEILLQEYLESNSSISGALAFKLYDTFGFPIDLTKEIALEKHVEIDLDGFLTCLQEQKNRSRQALKKNISMNAQAEDLMNFTLKSVFNYEKSEIETKIIGLFKDGVKEDSLQGNGLVVLQETPFYALSGGQISDEGILILNGETIEVNDVVKLPRKQNALLVNLNEGITLKEGDVVLAKIDVNKRLLVKRAHSSVHLLQAALRKVLNEDIHQAGSYVGAGEFRFDFTKKDKVSETDLKLVEDLVNQQISLGLDGKTQELEINEAKKTGAIALFDEKYDNVVRVVSFGDFSIEFCGGTHVTNTQDIGIFIIDSEGSIGNGVRRISGRVSYNAYQEYNNNTNLLKNISEVLKQNNTLNLVSNIQNLIDEKNEYKLKLSKLETLLFNQKVQNYLKESLIFIDEEITKEQLLTLSDLAKQKYSEYLIVAADFKEQINLTISGNQANEILQKLISKYHGRGGGRPNLAFGSIPKVIDFPTLKKEVLLCRG
jgi:alanyl-tRNA synthetase